MNHEIIKKTSKKKSEHAKFNHCRKALAECYDWSYWNKTAEKIFIKIHINIINNIRKYYMNIFFLNIYKERES